MNNAAGAFNNAANNVQDAIKPDAVYTNNFNAVPEQQESKTLSIVSMVLGIVSLLGGCCCGLLGLPCSIAAIVTGIIAKVKNKPGAGFAIAGIITGAVGIIVAIVSVILGNAMLKDMGGLKFQ